MRSLYWNDTEWTIAPADEDGHGAEMIRDVEANRYQIDETWNFAHIASEARYAADTCAFDFTGVTDAATNAQLNSDQWTDGIAMAMDYCAHQARLRAITKIIDASRAAVKAAEDLHEHLSEWYT